jgi:dUTP pyrophosphatase
MKIKFKKINKLANMPAYETPQSAGMDIRACINKTVLLKPLERALIPTGLAVEVKNGYEVQVRARSGLALKNGICLANGIGTIDSDYRGEIGVILINLGQEDFVVNNGDRIAQLVVMKHETPIIIEDENLSDSERQSGGFGSTGLK